MISTRIRSHPAPGPVATRVSTSSTDQTPASAAIPAAARIPASLPGPGSDRLTDAKSGRAAGARLAHSATAACRASGSRPVIHSPVDTPTGTPGHAWRIAATAAPMSAALQRLAAAGAARVHVDRFRSGCDRTRGRQRQLGRGHRDPRMIVAAASPVEAHLDLPDALHRDMLARCCRFTDSFSVDSVLGHPGSAEVAWPL